MNGNVLAPQVETQRRLKTCLKMVCQPQHLRMLQMDKRLRIM